MGIIMDGIFSRTELLLGEEAVKKLNNSRVAVFGVGGVGGFVVEALARCGVGELDIIDNDRVAASNINRQLIALNSTVGRYKVDVFRERLLDINPKIKVNAYNTFFMPETSGEFDFSLYDYVVDAIDTVTGKLELVMKAQRSMTPIISAMGAGNKLDPTAFEVADIFETSVCPLARVMRSELKKRGVKKLKVVYSKEKPILNGSASEPNKKRIPGSVSFVPSVAGMIIAGEVIKDLIRKE